MKKALLMGVGVVVVSAVTAMGIRAGIRTIVKMKATDEETE